MIHMIIKIIVYILYITTMHHVKQITLSFIILKTIFQLNIRILINNYAKIFNCFICKLYTIIHFLYKI